MNHTITHTLTTGALIASLLAPALALGQVDASAQIKVNGTNVDVNAGGVRVNTGNKGDVKVNTGGVKVNAPGKGDVRVKTIDGGNVKVMKSTTTATSTKPKKDDVRFQPAIQANLKGKINAFLIRFEKAIALEENLVTRVDSRIAKVEAEGRTATTSKKYSAEAKVHIKAAKDALAGIKTTIGATTTTSTTISKDAAKAIVARFETVKTHLKEAHRSIVAAISNLKGVGVRAGTATTTVKTNNRGTSVDVTTGTNVNVVAPSVNVNVTQ